MNAEEFERMVSDVRNENNSEYYFVGLMNEKKKRKEK